jgi:hypothetical protein
MPGGTNGVLLYLEGKLQLKHFYTNQSIEHILCSQTNNGAAFVPDSEARLKKPGNVSSSSFPCRFKNGGSLR